MYKEFQTSAVTSIISRSYSYCDYVWSCSEFMLSRGDRKRDGRLYVATTMTVTTTDHAFKSECVPIRQTARKRALYVSFTDLPAVLVKLADRLMIQQVLRVGASWFGGGVRFFFSFFFCSQYWKDRGTSPIRKRSADSLKSFWITEETFMNAGRLKLFDLLKRLFLNEELLGNLIYNDLWLYFTSNNCKK